MGPPITNSGNFFPYPYVDMSTMSQTDLINSQSVYENMATDGGPGMIKENWQVLGMNIPVPFADSWNRFASGIGRKLLGYQDGQNPAMAMMYSGAGTLGSPQSYNSRYTTSDAGNPGVPGGDRVGGFVKGRPADAFPDVTGVGIYSFSRFVGGFGGQGEQILSFAGPQLNTMEGALSGLRSKIGSGQELTQAEMLQYQDLMQRQNQLFMFCQNCFTSEHEKVKNWGQALGRI